MKLIHDFELKKQENQAKIDFYFQVYIDVKILQNGKVLDTKIFTGVKFNHEFNEVLEIPLRVCDLAPISSLSISIYSMDQIDQKPLAST